MSSFKRHISTFLFIINSMIAFSLPGESVGLNNHFSYSFEIEMVHVVLLMEDFIQNHRKTFAKFYEDKSIEFSDYTINLKDGRYNISDIRALKLITPEGYYFDVHYDIKQKLKKKFIFFYKRDSSIPVTVSFSFFYFPDHYLNDDVSIEEILSEFKAIFEDYLVKQTIEFTELE